MAETNGGGRRFAPTSGGAAFLLSLVIAFVGFGNAILGSQIDILPPDRIYLYREGEGKSSVVSLAVRLRMVNRSLNYNDVITRSTLYVCCQIAAFENTGIVRLVFSDNRDSTALCVAGTRCIARSNLAITDLPEDMIQIPAGSASSHVYSFRLICAAPGRDCSRYGVSQQTIRWLGDGPLDIVIALRLNQDGERLVRCRTRRIDSDDFQRRGWQGLRCDQSSVHGDSRYSLF
ncbi:MAG TPA: hypothetical protein VEW71_04460 [Allosphingosinicella sp.]|nr:hypothetical protein [Allosphingosinicella sp.]